MVYQQLTKDKKLDVAWIKGALQTAFAAMNLLYMNNSSYAYYVWESLWMYIWQIY